MEKKELITEEGRRRVLAVLGKDSDYHQAIMDVVYENWNAHNDALLYALGRRDDETPVFVGTKEECQKFFEEERQKFFEELPEGERSELKFTMIAGQVDWGLVDMLEDAAERFGTAFKFFSQLGNYNYQVGNGGHYQYFDNGYASGDGGCFQKHDADCPLHAELLEAFDAVLTDNAPEELKEIIGAGRRIIARFHISVDDERYVDEDCDECSGTGKIECTACGGDGCDEEGETCPECGGSGYLKCGSCDGKGTVEVDNENYGFPDNQHFLDKLDSEWYEINDAFIDASNVIAKKLIEG